MANEQLMQGWVFPPNTLTMGKGRYLPDGRWEQEFIYTPTGVDPKPVDESYTQAFFTTTAIGAWPEPEKPLDTRSWWARRVRPWLPAVLVFVVGPMALCFLEGPWWAGLSVGLVCVWGVVAAIPEESGR